MDQGQPHSDAHSSHHLLLRLPEGMSEREWNREMGRWQNPRIRTILGCLRKIAGALESNFAMLHCSPRRIQGIRDAVAEVSDRLRNQAADQCILHFCGLAAHQLIADKVFDDRHTIIG